MGLEPMPFHLYGQPPGEYEYFLPTFAETLIKCPYRSGWKLVEEMVRIVKALETHGVAVQSIEMKEPTLERVFLHLTGRELRD